MITNEMGGAVMRKLLDEFPRAMVFSSSRVSPCNVPLVGPSSTTKISSAFLMISWHPACREQPPLRRPHPKLRGCPLAVTHYNYWYLLVFVRNLSRRLRRRTAAGTPS